MTETRPLPRRWWVWVPLLGVAVQIVRIRHDMDWLDEPGVDARGASWPRLRHEERALRQALWVTAGALGSVILVALVLTAMRMGRVA